MRVLTVGAGIGGLVTALRLHRLGIGCEVVEQGTGTGELGVGINLRTPCASSTVRAALFPGEGPPRWNGVQMWRGATEWPAFRGCRSMIIAGGTAAKLVLYPIARGATPDTVLTNWAVCVLTGRDGDPPPRRQDWSRRADPSDALRHAGYLAVPDVDHTALVRATEEIFEFPMCDRDPLPRWSHGRVTLLGGVTLLGDAAHPMYPMGSNGAGQASLDATCLAEALTRHPDPVVALAAYEHERLPATADIVLRNRAGGPAGRRASSTRSSAARRRASPAART